MTEPFVVETLADAEQQLGRAQAGFSGLAFLFGLVALAVGAFLVANTLAMTLAERHARDRAAAGGWHDLAPGAGPLPAPGPGAGGGRRAAGRGGGRAAGQPDDRVPASTRALLIGGPPFSLGALALAFGLGAAGHAGRRRGARAGRRAALATGRAAAIAPARPHAGRPPAVAGRPGDRGRGHRRGGVPAAARPGGAARARCWRWRMLLGGRCAGGVPAAAAGPDRRPAVRRLLRRAGLPGPRQPGPRPGPHRPDGGGPGHRPVVGGGAGHRLRPPPARPPTRWVDSILPGGHAIRLGVPDEIDRVRDDLATITGVERVMPDQRVPGGRGDRCGQREVGIAGIDPTDFQDTGSLIFVAGQRRDAFKALRDGGAVLLPESVASRDGLAVGDMIKLAQPGGDGSPVQGGRHRRLLAADADRRGRHPHEPGRCARVASA